MMRTKAFYTGSLIGFGLIVIANLYSYDNMYAAGCFDCIVGFGWPFRWHETGGYFGMTRILWAGLISDVILAISLGIAAGLLNARFISPRKHKFVQNFQKIWTEWL